MMWIGLKKESAFEEVAQSLPDLKQLYVVQGIKHSEGYLVCSSQRCEECYLFCTSQEILCADDV